MFPADKRPVHTVLEWRNRLRHSTKGFILHPTQTDCNFPRFVLVFSAKLNIAIAATDMKHRFATLTIALALTSVSLVAADVDPDKLPPPSTKQGLTFAKDILPIFKASCLQCHGEMRPRGDLRLDSLEATMKGGENGKILVPGKSAQSSLVIAVSRLDKETAMPRQLRARPGEAPPPKINDLTAEEVGIIRAWIDQGAK